MKNCKYKRGTKKIKKAENGLQIVGDDGKLTAGATQIGGTASALGAGLIEGATASKYDPKYTSQLKDENQAVGRTIGGGAGMALNLVAPGLGTLAAPLLSSAGGAIQRGLQGNKLASIQKTDEFNQRIAKHNENITSDLTSMQAKQYSKGGKASSKVIEIEGKETPEIHTDKNFNVKNLGTTPHSKGGNKVLAKEGDVIFPTQNDPNKYDKIMTAIKRGDKKTLKKEQNKLPTDKAPKMSEGNGGLKWKRSMSDYMYEAPETGNFKHSPAMNNYSPLKPNPLNDSGWIPQGKAAKVAPKKGNRGPAKSGPSRVNPLVKMDSKEAPSLANAPAPLEGVASKIATAPLTPSNSDGSYGEKTKKGKGGSGEFGLNQAMELAPIAYNLGQGLFGKAEKANRRYINPTLEKYVDTSAALKSQANSGYEANVANARNLSGGLGSNVRANSQAAANQKLEQLNSINGQEYGKQVDVNNRNTQIINRGKTVNLEMDNQYDEIDAQNRGMKSQALATGLTDLGALGSRNILQKNTLDTWKINADMLEKPQYGSDVQTRGSQITGLTTGWNGTSAMGSFQHGLGFRRQEKVRGTVPVKEKGAKSIRMNKYKGGKKC